MRRIFIPILTAMLFAGCKGDTGPMGADGPEGQQGPQGIQGPPGAVIGAIETIVLRTTDFESNDLLELAQYSVPSITQDIVDDGVVVAYSDFFGGWTLLPLTVPTSAGTVSMTVSYDAGELSVIILRSGGNPVGGVFGGTSVRLVVIPSAGAANALDASDYDRFLRTLAATNPSHSAR